MSNANFRGKKDEISWPIYCFVFFSLWHDHEPCARYWHCCPMGKGAVAIKLCLYIYTYIYVYTYIHAYITNFFVSKTMERVPQSGDGSWSVGEARMIYEDYAALLLSKPRPVLQSLCFTPSLLLSSFTLPHPPSSPPSYIPLLWMLLVLFAGCLTWLLAFVQCKLHAGSGLGVGGGYKEAVMMSKALPFLFPLCIC